MASWNTPYYVTFVPLHKCPLPRSPFPIPPTSTWRTLSSLVFNTCLTIPSPARRLMITFLVNSLCYAYTWHTHLSSNTWVLSTGPVLRAQYFNSNQRKGSEGNLSMCWAVRGPGVSSALSVQEGTGPNKLGVSTCVTGALERIPLLPNPDGSPIILRRLLDGVQQMKVFTLDKMCLRNRSVWKMSLFCLCKPCRLCGRCHQVTPLAPLSPLGIGSFLQFGKAGCTNKGWPWAGWISARQSTHTG